MALVEGVAISGNGERELCIDRLTGIDGIARKTAEAMYEIGIQGYADLAQYLSLHTARQVSAALREQGIHRPPAFIDRESWVRQARELGGLPDAVLESNREQIRPARQPEEAHAGETGAAAGTVAEEACDTRLTIGDNQLSILRSSSGTPEQRLQARISFQLSGSAAEELAAKGIPYRIEGYTVDAESGASELVGSESSQLVPQVFEYVGHQEFDVPEVGRYEFHSVVLLLPPGEMAAFRRGPTVRVVP